MTSMGGTQSATKKFIVIIFWEIKIWKIMGTLWILFLHMRKFMHWRNPSCMYVEMLKWSEMGCLPYLDFNCFNLAVWHYFQVYNYKGNYPVMDHYMDHAYWYGTGKWHVLHK